MAISDERKKELEKIKEEKGQVSDEDMRSKSVEYEANKSSSKPK